MTAAVFAAVVGVLVAGGVYLLLRARTFPVVLGLTLLSYAVNLFLFASGRLTPDSAPLTVKGITDQPDPLPQALVLTAIVIGFGMTAYVWSSPKDFSMLGAGLSALFLPMLVLMGVGVVFPSMFGGPLGIALSAVFVIVSAGGLLYQINNVLHRLATNQHIEGAYLITMGVLVLYWNILTLLMRLNRR